MIQKTRVAVFGSFYGGHRILRQLLSLPDEFEVVGIATDDPESEHCNAGGRLWKLPHRKEEELMVRHLAGDFSIPAYTGSISADGFYHVFSEIWKPDLCVMATFGQRITRKFLDIPRLGFFNFHHSLRGVWPSYPGPNPIERIVQDGYESVCISVHFVNERFDDGPLFSQSPEVPLTYGDNAITVHRRSWDALSMFTRKTLLELISQGFSSLTSHLASQQPLRCEGNHKTLHDF